MPFTIDAVYANGVLKPAQPLPLVEHAQVRVTVEQQQVAERAAAGGVEDPGLLTAEERIAARAERLPHEVVAAWPTDGASQHDHYLYGKPKRLE